MMIFVRACVLVVLLVGACRSDGAELPSADLAAERFSARGRVTGVHAKALEIHHERIASMRTFDGKLEAMEPMTMVFSATTSASIAGLSVGDPVRFDFTVHYKNPPTLRLIAIEKLPADTPLALP